MRQLHCYFIFILTITFLRKFSMAFNTYEITAEQRAALLSPQICSDNNAELNETLQSIKQTDR